jgi:chorismate mutase
MRVRGIRGATQLSVDTPEEMNSAVGDLLGEMLTANSLKTEDLISIVLTSTADLVSEFPAAAARNIGLGGIPLLCAVEIDVAGSMRRVVRVLIHAHMDVPHDQVKHIYLRGAVSLRKDLPQ